MLNSEVQKNTSQAPAPVLGLLDFCKGLAIVWIVLIHWRPEWFGWQGVHVFIVLSGFGLTYSCLKRDSDISWKKWYVKRFRKVLPSYWMVCLWGYLILACVYLFEGRNLLNALSLPLDVLVNDALLLKLTLLNPIVKVEPNGSLWFIPFIVSFYLAFPWLYQLVVKHKTVRVVLFALLVTIVFEFVYRAIALYWLDGIPTGYRHYAKLFPVLGVPLDKLPTDFRFQHEYAFDFFPSRLGEFAIGMVAAVGLVRNSSIFHKVLLNPWMGVLGFLIWLAGNALIYQGFWGWVFADFVIAVGIILWFLNLGSFLQKKLPAFFSKMSQLGVWSYYIFLTHYLLVFITQKMDAPLTPLFDNSAIGIKVLRVSLFGAILVGTWISSRILERFDRSQFSDLMIQKTFAKVLK
ncbi:acyltransferase 3 [Scytonema sp. HK-05]|uniref:acyltransferase family protein n=1 Tax=Scytonema sp. HK-05 TaxID=1137095 RepID=UPI000A6A068A|nr:acyltransferase [Scytonema sp. HK-05]BAY42677.1 acyltransferase 3 [Scytonema sp. HK-05]